MINGGNNGISGDYSFGKLGTGQLNQIPFHPQAVDRSELGRTHMRDAAADVKHEDDRRLFHNAALRKRRKELGDQFDIAKRQHRGTTEPIELRTDGKKLHADGRSEKCQESYCRRPEDASVVH